MGKKVVETLHIHYSKIEYTNRGEKMHHPNTNLDWGPAIEPLFQIIRENGYSPVIINESPELANDALILKKKWNHS